MWEHAVPVCGQQQLSVHPWAFAQMHARNGKLRAGSQPSPLACGGSRTLGCSVYVYSSEEDVLARKGLRSRACCRIVKGELYVCMHICVSVMDPCVHAHVCTGASAHVRACGGQRSRANVLLNHSTLFSVSGGLPASGARFGPAGGSSCVTLPSSKLPSVHCVPALLWALGIQARPSRRMSSKFTQCCLPSSLMGSVERLEKGAVSPPK